MYSICSNCNFSVILAHSMRIPAIFLLIFLFYIIVSLIAAWKHRKPGENQFESPSPFSLNSVV